VTTLKANSIGLPHVLFQSITHMAPAVSLTFVLLTAVSFAGPVLPLTLIISLGVILCVASAIGQMAKEIPSAGGIYNYVANGIGPKAGFMIGWAYLVIEPLVAPLLFLELAFVPRGRIRASALALRLAHLGHRRGGRDLRAGVPRRASVNARRGDAGRL
jgi:hypothetical protein